MEEELIKIIRKMEAAGESKQTISAVVKAYTESEVKKKDISEPVGDTEGTMASTTEQAPASPFFLDSQSSDPIAERGIGFEEPDYANTDQAQKQLISADSQPSDPIAERGIGFEKPTPPDSQLSKENQPVDGGTLIDAGEEMPQQKEVVEEIIPDDKFGVYDIENTTLKNLGSKDLDAMELAAKTKQNRLVKVAEQTIIDDAIIAKEYDMTLEKYRLAILDTYAKKMLDGLDYSEYETQQKLSYLQEQKSNLPPGSSALEGMDSEIKSLEKKRSEYVNNRIAQVGAQIENIKATIDYSDKSDTKEKLEEIKKLQMSLKPVINPVAYAREKAETSDVKAMPGDNPMEQLTNYYHSLAREYSDILKNTSNLEVITSAVPILGDIVGTRKVRDRVYELHQELIELTPIVTLNRKELKEDNFFSQFAKGTVGALLSPNIVTTEQEQANKLYSSFEAAGVSGSLSKETDEALQESLDITLMEEIGSMTGFVAGMMPAFISGGAIIKGVGTVARGANLLNKVDKFNKMNKATRLLVSATTKGLEYEAAGAISTSSTVEEEASFLSGFMGETFTRGLSKLVPKKVYNATMLKLFGGSSNKVKDIFMKSSAKVASKTGYGFGEVAEEYGNEIGNIINESDGDLKKFIDLHSERFGDFDENVKFGLMTFGMGMAFGAATNSGKAFMTTHKEWLGKQTPEVQAEFTTIAADIENNLDSVTEEIVAEETVAEAALVVEEAVAEEEKGLVVFEPKNAEYLSDVEKKRVESGEVFPNKEYGFQVVPKELEGQKPSTNAQRGVDGGNTFFTGEQLIESGFVENVKKAKAEAAPVVEEAVVEETVVEEVAAKTRQKNISERSNKNLFEDQRSSKELPYNKGKDGKGRADIYDITKPDEKGVATAQYASPDGSVDIIVSAKNNKNFVGYTRIYENGEPTNMFTAKMESTGDAFKNMITSAEAKLPDNAEVVEKTSISEGGLKVYNKSNLTEKLDEDGNVVTRPTKYSAATKESLDYKPFKTTDKAAAEAEVDKIKAAYPGINATIKEVEVEQKPLEPFTPNKVVKKTAPKPIPIKPKFEISIDLPVLIKSQKTKTEAVAEEAAMSKKVGASINEEEAEKAAPVETTTEEITIFRGLQPKKDVKGKPKTVHKIKKGKFGSAKIEGTDGNKGTKPIKKFTIPAGTTVETVKLPGNTPAATSRVELETEAIDNSTAQVVKLETIDAGGRETQYIIKDDSLLESGVDMTAEEEASARSKPKNRIISDEAYAKAEKELKDMMGNISSGTGFKGAGALAVVVARKLEDGAISVAEMTTEMVKIFGEKIRPHVKAAYDTATKPKQKQKRKSKTQKDIDDTVSDKRNKVTVDEIVALKSQIKVLDRGAKTAKKSIETATKNLAAEVKELVKKGKINVSQMNSVMNKFSKVDMFKEEKIEEFVDYMTKVFNDADYANKIINAKNIVAKIKKQSKKGEITISTAGKEFAKINPSLVDDIDLFLEQADKVLEGLRKTTKSDLAKGNTKETFNIKEVNEYVSSTIESQDKKIYDAKRKTFHNTTGIDPSELTLKEMDSLLNKLTGKELTEEQKAKESKDKSEIIDKAAKNAFANFSESVSIGIKDGSIKVSKDTKKIIGKFLKIDLALLNTENKILAIDAIINFKTNPEATGGMGALSDQYKGNEGMFDLFKQNIAANTRSTGTGEIWSINLSTLPLAIESYFKGQSKALKVMDKIGIDGVVNGSAKAETDANKLTEVYAKKFKKKKMKKGKYFDDFNEIERGVLAFVRRTVSGTIEEKKIEFNRRKKMVKETYVELLKSTDNVSKKTGELIEASYDKLVAKSENYNEVDKKADPVNLEGVEHVSKDWENLYPDLASVALDYYNINLGKDLNFTPDNLVLTGKEDTKSDIDKPIYNPDPGLRDEESGRLKENNRINALPKGRILSLGFDTQNYRNLKDAMTDINTAPSIKQIKGAMDSKYFEKVFVNESSRRVIKDKIYKYVELKRGKDFETPLNKNILRKLGRTTALGVRMVLGGVTQPIKQIVPLANTIVNAGIENTTSAAKLMLDKEVRDAVNNSGLPIANRGASSQGDIESVNSRIRNTTENILNKFITKSDQLNKYIIDKTLVYTDVAVAKTSFVAYYIKAMKKNGVEASDIDWTKPLDKEAGAYAMQQVNRQQNVSDSDLQGAFFTDKKIVTQLVRKTAFTFANFLINQKTRTYSDINTLFRNPTANKGDKAAALRSLGGLGVETIAFNAVGLALNEGITAIHYALKGEDESEEEKEKRRKNQIKGKAGNIVKDLISPIPLVDDLVIWAANLALELMADSEDEDPFQLFSNDTKTFVQRMGVLGIPLQKLSNLYEMGRIVATGEIENEYMGKKTTKKVSDENIDYMRTVAPIYLLYISGGLGLSEIGYMSEKALKEVKRSKELGFAKSSVTDIKEFAPDLYDDLKQLKDELKDLEVDID